MNAVQIEQKSYEMPPREGIRLVARACTSQFISRVPRPSFAWAGIFVDCHRSSDGNSAGARMDLISSKSPP
jgi:hypothetical protein